MASEFNLLTLTGHEKSDEVHRELKKHGVDFATGLPCGILRHLIYNFEHDPEVNHLPGLNEPEAIGIATGAWLAGKTPAIYMQNSGMLKAVNDIGGLMMASKAPSLMIVTYRGCPGEDATQHLLTGSITIPTLDALGIKYHDLNDAKDISRTIDDCFDFMDKTGDPAVLLVRRGWANLGKTENPLSVDSLRPQQPLQPEDPASASLNALSKIVDYTGGRIMDRDEALEALLPLTNESMAVISTTGIMSRYIFENFDSPNQFYNCGGFGQTSVIASGFATSRPDIQTLAIDGDSSLLTNFGALVTNGNRGTENLTHLVIDNAAYASCSEERSLSPQANIPLVAAIQNYKNVFLVDSQEGLERAFLDSTREEGPNFIYATIKLGGPRNPKRPTAMDITAKRFREHFNEI